MRTFNVEQRSPEWLRARLGRPTASRAADALAFLKPKKDEAPAPAKARIDYAEELAFERVTGGLIEHYVNGAMMRGEELEPDARAAYEAQTGALVDEVGFCLHDQVDAGASPDGLVGEDGLIEIKCPASQAKVAHMWATGDVSEYVPQVEWQLWVTGRKWCDICVYDPRLHHCGMELLVVRHEMTEEARQRLDVMVPDFLAFVGEVEATIRKRVKR